MKAIAKVKNFRTEESRAKIARNLSRIMDIRILDLDQGNQLLTVAYTSPAVLRKVIRELRSIGFPVQRLDELEHTGQSVHFELPGR